ncbi:unnamed protein product [Urochloa humidicola]
MAAHCSGAICALLLLSFSRLALSDYAPPLAPVSASDACSDTTDPSLGWSVLPPRGKVDLYTYGRFSVSESLAGARKFAALVDRYLTLHHRLSKCAVAALRDCQLMAELNVDFLSDAGAAIQSTDTLLDQQADDVHTLLSAVVTNQQTCFDGLQQVAAGSWSGGGFDAPLANSTKLYSLSLSLFTRAWVPTARPAARHPHKGGKAPPHHGHGGKHGKKAPAARWGLFDVTNDEMVQQMAMEGPERTVSVNAVVTVDQSGAGNFTTVGAAVAAAPRNLNGSGGYYLIHVLAGVYEENVTVPKHSKYIMMVGDGIGKTVTPATRASGSMV